MSICIECKELVKPDWVSHEDENGNLVCLDCDNRYEVSEEMFGCSILISKSFVVDRYPHFCVDLKGNKIIGYHEDDEKFYIKLENSVLSEWDNKVYWYKNLFTSEEIEEEKKELGVI